MKLYTQHQKRKIKKKNKITIKNGAVALSNIHTIYSILVI